MDHQALKSWLDAYGRAWETRDPRAVGELFSENATYQETPFAEPMRGRSAIREYWSLKVERAQETPRFSYEILAALGNTGIAHWKASFVRTASRAKVKLDGVFVLTFDSDNRCLELREWWVKQEDKA
jgi:nuclear transport factor 2 (NTF2) superfamily protein